MNVVKTLRVILLLGIKRHCSHRLVCSKSYQESEPLKPFASQISLKKRSGIVELERAFLWIQPPLKQDVALQKLKPILHYNAWHLNPRSRFLSSHAILTEDLTLPLETSPIYQFILHLKLIKSSSFIMDDHKKKSRTLKQFFTLCSPIPPARLILGSTLLQQATPGTPKLSPWQAPPRHQQKKPDVNRRYLNYNFPSLQRATLHHFSERGATTCLGSGPGTHCIPSA